MKQILVLSMFFGFLFAEDNIAKYKVKGMQCAQSCPVKITEAIKKIDGVKTCDVNFDQNTATVTYDQDKIDSKALAEAINAATDYDVSDKKRKKRKVVHFFSVSLAVPNIIKYHVKKNPT